MKLFFFLLTILVEIVFFSICHIQHKQNKFV